MNPILTWYGHSCFRLDFGEGGSVIFDPYAPGSVPGVELPEGLTADAVFCSHGHGDHNAAGRVTLSGRTPAFTAAGIDTFHDPEKGKLRGPDRITIVEYNGFRAAHLGDLGCALEGGEMDRLRNLDLLLLPVGGHFTIGPAEAKALWEELRPRIAVPMHYRRGSMGFPVISELKEFTGLFDAWTEVGANTLSLTPELSGIYVMTP
jgi:L-ascorbate metabolism protein UlaG (beta-lactamase superfamily)